MLNCRSITPEAWAQAREALIFYFSRRHGSDRADDLAQETLAALWIREDYEFEKEEDFLRVCLGFARMISQAGYRQTRRESEFVGMEHEAMSPNHHPDGAAATEHRILLEQICTLGESRLREQDWQLVVQAATSDGEPTDMIPSERNRFRVSLHRARKKLEKITGWRH